MKMVKLLDLQESVERKVRTVIKSPTGNITVFEPNVDDFNKVLEVQREKGTTRSDSVEFEDVVVIRELFPILTDLDMSGATDEDIQKIINKPSVQLLTVQNVVSQIVAEINVVFIERMKTEIIQANSAVAQISLLNMIPQVMKEEAKRKGDDKSLKNLESIDKEIKEGV